MLSIYISIYMYMYNGTFVLDFCPAICSCPDPALESSLQRFPKFVLSQPSPGDKSWQVHSRTSAKRYPVPLFFKILVPPGGSFLNDEFVWLLGPRFQETSICPRVCFKNPLTYYSMYGMVTNIFAILVVKKRVNLPYIWVTYSDLTMTWLESWFVRGTIPMPYFILFQVIG